VHGHFSKMVAMTQPGKSSRGVPFLWSE